jgi:hypothetical protein
MIDRLLTPPFYTDLSDEVPVVFLAGPIQGSPDWQTPTARRILAANERLLVASPRRSELDEDFNKRKQVEWELDHLWYASQLGGVAFWFAAQDHSLPYKAGRPHAQTSRVEVGAMMMLKRINPSTKLWVGFDPDYTKNGSGSEEYIRIANEWFTGRDEVFDSLDEMTDTIIEDMAEAA